MIYISGIHALNLNCSLETTGDWHQSALKWENILFLDTKDSIFGEYGIEHNKAIPNHNDRYSVANHIRAILDMLELGNLSTLQGMRNDFICTDKYDDELFNKIILLKSKKHWDGIDKLISKEYMLKWKNFKKKNNVI